MILAIFIKHYGADYFLCKCREKVTTETALMYLSYDIRRAIALAGGVQALLSLLIPRKK